MRIVFVIPYFYGAWAYGGQPRSAYEMAKGLVLNGHSVKVLTTDSAGDHRLSKGAGNTFIRTIEGIEIHYYRNISNRIAFRHRVFWPPEFFRNLKSEISGADVVHIHELRSLLTVAASAAAARQSIPVVLSPHGGLKHLGKQSLKRIFDALWGRRILQRTAALVAISPVEVEDAQRLHVDRSKVFQVPNSIPIPPPSQLPPEGRFRARHRLSAPRLILFLGRLHPLKGADILLEAFANLCNDHGDTSTHLVLAGPDDGQEGQLRHLAGQLKISDRVTFAGYLDEQQKLEALVDSRLVVIPSRSEVFAIVGVEALLCSRPVIMSSACGIYPAPERRHGVLFFNENSVEDLASTLFGALDDKELFESATAGRDFVAKEFAPQAVTSRLEDVYRAVSKK